MRALTAGDIAVTVPLQPPQEGTPEPEAEEEKLSSPSAFRLDSWKRQTQRKEFTAPLHDP